MRKLLATVMSVAVLAALSPALTLAQTACPPEVAQAKDMLKQKQTLAKSKGTVAKAQDVQAPRTLAGARAQDVQAPRSQEVQAPRSQDVQAPRSTVGAKSKDVQAPRAEDLKRAASLIKEAEGACKAGKMDVAADKAKKAMSLLK